MASDDWQVQSSHKKCRMEALRTLIVVFCLRSWVQRDSGLRRLVCRSNQQKVQDKGFICHNCGKLCNKSDMEQYVVASGDWYVHNIHKKCSIDRINTQDWDKLGSDSLGGI